MMQLRIVSQPLKQVSALPLKYASISNIERQVFARQHGFQWKSSIYPCVNRWEDSLAYFENAHINGVLCVNQSGLPAKTPIMEYTGDLLPADGQADDVYGASYVSFFGYSYKLSAKRVGNFSRFLPSLLSREAIDKNFAIDREQKDKVATANCILKTTLFGTILVYTLRAIQCGEILGFCYGDDFWHHRRIDTQGKDRLCLFEQYTGNVVDAKLRMIPMLASYKQIYIVSNIDSHDLEILPYDNITVGDHIILLGYVDIRTVQDALLSKTGVYVVEPTSRFVSYIKPELLSQYLQTYFSREEFSGDLYDVILSNPSCKLRAG